jgi:hypothetical protein
VTIKGEDGREEPILKEAVPPLFPVNLIFDPFKIVITEPLLAVKSNMAGEKGSPNVDCTISPVTERVPSGFMITVPPLLPRKNVPKIRPCEAWAEIVDLCDITTSKLISRLTSNISFLIFILINIGEIVVV